MNLELLDFKDVSPPFALALAINLFFFFLKRVPGFPARAAALFPLLAMLIGGVVYPLATDPSKVPYQVRSPLVAQVIMGFCSGGLAILFNQQFKQLLTKAGVGGDTEFLNKDDYGKAIKNSSPGNPTGGPV